MRYLITAIGSMSAKAVIQTICEKPGAVAIGCSIHPGEWTSTSRLVERFYIVPPARDTAAYLARLLEICEAEQISHIIPLTDPEVDVLSTNRRNFEEIGITLCISPTAAVQAARDKAAIHRQFANHPHIRPIPTADLQHGEDPSLAYPLFAKPRRGRSSEGQVTISDSAALGFWRERLADQNYIVQPRLNGDIFVVDVVRQPDGLRAVAMTRRELLRTPNGAGMTVHMQPEHVCGALAIEVAAALGLCGCINIEFLMVDGEPLLMDVNPRFSAGVAFSIMSGYDMVSNHLRCFEGNPIERGLAPPNKIYTRETIEY